MSEKNPAAGYAFRAARDIYRELQTTAARCRDERVKELRLYIAQNENNLTKAREQVAQLPGVIADYQRELAALGCRGGGFLSDVDGCAVRVRKGGVPAWTEADRDRRRVRMRRQTDLQAAGQPWRPGEMR